MKTLSKKLLIWIISGVCVLGVATFFLLNALICKHEFDSGVVTTASICTKEGVKTRKFIH